MSGAAGGRRRLVKSCWKQRGAWLRGVLARCGAGHAWTLGLVQRPVVLSKLLLPWLSAVLDFCWVERVWIGDAPDNAYSQGDQELNASAGT